MQKLVEVLADKQALIAKSLALVLEKITTSLDQQDYFTIALSGGSTPKPLLRGFILSTPRLVKNSRFLGR